MFKKFKSRVVFARPGVNLRQCERHLWPVQRVPRFGKEHHGAFALDNGGILFTQTGKYYPEHHVTRRIIRAFLYRFFQNRPSTLKRRAGMLLIIHESVKSALEVL